MDNGSGDTYQIIFFDTATVVRGFDHESNMSPWGLPDFELAPGVIDGLPEDLIDVIYEPSFACQGGPRAELTFCAWHVGAGQGWSAGTADEDGGGSWLLELVLDTSPTAYQAYALDYLETNVPLEPIVHFYDLAPATRPIVSALNPEADYTAIAAALTEMGYPVE